MSRSKSRLWLVIPVLRWQSSRSACAGGGEEKILLTKYFTASKVSDNMTLSNIATVAFDPKTDGQMQTFSIVSVAEPVVTPLEIKKHAEDLKAASDEEKTFTDKKKVFQDANGDAIDRILKAEQKGQTLKGKDAELQKEWTKWREETAVVRQEGLSGPQARRRRPADRRDQLPGPAEPDRHHGLRGRVRHARTSRSTPR